MSIILQNKYVKIELSEKDASVLSVKGADKRELMAESTPFINLTDSEWNLYKNESLVLSGDKLILTTELGQVEILVRTCDTHFVFEVLTHLPEKAYCMNFGYIKYDYDFDNREDWRGVGVAMTINADPRYFPDGYPKTTFAKTYEHLGDGPVGAAYALAIVPEPVLQDTLKEICSKIDPEKGIVLKTAGPWSFENKLAQGSYAKANDCRRSTIEVTSKIYREIGVDQVFYQQNSMNTFHQGNFKYACYRDDEDFKKNVADYMNEQGIEVGIHTYAQYINFECHDLLSNPEYQQMIEYGEEFTLAEDISADADFIPTVESTAGVSRVYGFFEKNMPIALIGNEFVRYVNHDSGFASCERGYCGTTAVAHKKGEKIRHALGCFGKLAPLPGTELFLQVARNTANAFNRGGYSMIYLDAIDGTHKHCKKEERPFYIAQFVHEILKNCDREPLIELSDMPASVWASRARMGAWDMPYRNYKLFNEVHHKDNLINSRRFYNSTLGWYNYYPMEDAYPGNQHVKYHHTDAVDHMGALSVMYDYSTVFNGGYDIHRYEGCRRNIERYNFYANLRKSHYFTEDVLKKARANENELAIVKKDNGKCVFVEKNYDTKRLYGITEPDRSTAAFENPFKKQTPFVRLEACMSSYGDDSFVLLPLNEKVPLSEQIKTYDFGEEINCSKHLALKVRVKGNGKKGSVGIKLRAGGRSGHGYGLYVIDTEFDGWRDFVLLETDNGSRLELGFEEGLHAYALHRMYLNMAQVYSAEVMTSGDVEGVYMSSVTACRYTYDVIKNPTVKIGDESVMFECELQSTDFIEWDGKRAVVIDRFANEKEVYFTGNITAPKGKFNASVSCNSLNGCPVNVYLTMGTTGKEIK